MKTLTLLSVSIICGLLIAMNANAQQSESTLEQTISPIDCVYTNVTTGLGQETSSVCSDQSAPTLENVTLNSQQKPTLTGKFTFAETRSLRVWVGGVWYTLGVSPYLSINGDIWNLNLSSSSNSLPPGNYTIIVEVLTHDSFQLRSVYVDALSIKQTLTPQPEAPIINTDTAFNSRDSNETYSYLLRGDGTYIQTPALISNRLDSKASIATGPQPIDHGVGAKSDEDINNTLATIIATGSITAGVWLFASKHRIFLRDDK